MKILDWYILKRYLVTFFVLLLLFVPIGIIIDVSEKINKILANKVPLPAVLMYYLDFTIYFANMLFPILLFISIIWFTSKLANNTEIVAILSSGISFTRFLRPYIIGATFISIFALVMSVFIVPKASQGYNDFRYKYMKSAEVRESQNVYRQISPTEFIYVSNFNYNSKTGYNFSLEVFDGNKMTSKTTANRIVWNPETETYTLFGYFKREISETEDIFERAEEKEMKLDFDIDDLTPVVYAAETMQLGPLKRFIEKEQMRGSSNINVYLVVLYKKYSVPVSAFILTIIAVSVSSMKRRGGMGMNLAIGIALAFIYVFFDKIFGTLAEASSIPPLVAVWLPNVVFGILAIFLLRNARR
ncbi:LptF/LptG family permease [Myroides profundi]|uniref:Lipopolysaccharide export system permease protein n=1 Tax=Myroides profundi TaxID=480520 RepID=A0AAJ5BDM4_MYRPR|nr:LptF/LptG family permease [Myroides profundi]AJH15993.1 lipopolysaccharide export system permease protein [Myroides profundi]SEQ68251.1 lipopolysaccharide export system permease protein [Myroides profundi]